MGRYVWQRWMADEFRAAGLDVIEVAGWKNRGRPASSGSFDPDGLNVHHTGVRQWASDPARGLPALIGGRSDLPGPIAHFATDYLGRIWVIAAGRANVNGRNRGVPNFPQRDGNAVLLGNEVFTDGRQTLPKVQRDAIALSSAVVLTRYGHADDVDGHLYRHADTSTTGKWDIGQLTTAQVRADARAAVIDLRTATQPPQPAPKEYPDMFRVRINQPGHQAHGQIHLVTATDVTHLSPSANHGFAHLPLVEHSVNAFVAIRDTIDRARDRIARELLGQGIGRHGGHPFEVVVADTLTVSQQAVRKLDELAQAAAPAAEKAGGA